MPPTEAAPSRHRRGALWSLASYAALFAVLLLPRGAVTLDRISREGNVYDAHLIVWILSWVAHALGTAPGTLFDANIDHPAPAQLTGSDHLFSSQIVFAPVYWLTGHPVLATSIVAFLTYPLAAFAMERLLRALGCSAAVAWTVGLLFALGPFRTPFNVLVLQYPNFYLPLVALALVRLRDRPDARRAVALVAAFGAGIFSAYYASVMLGLSAVVWGLAELARRGPGRLRFLVFAVGAGAAATGALVVFAGPYLARGAMQGAPPITTVIDVRAPFIAGRSLLHARPVDALPLAVGLLGALAAVTGGRPGRRAGVAGLVLAVVGYVLSWGFPQSWVPVLAASPIRFIRYPLRFRVVAGFGLALLAAAGLEAVRRRLPGRAGSVVAAAFGIVLVVDPARNLLRFETYGVAALGWNAWVYERVARIAREEGPGPLLELPLKGRCEATRERCSTEPDSMVGSTRHWLPLLGGYAGYQPPHRRLLVEHVWTLPAEWALEDLIDMTHLRWILVRPPAWWRRETDRTWLLNGLRRSGSLAPPLHMGGWTLFRVERTPAHQAWYEAIAKGWQPGTTVLGTPLVRLPDEAAIAVVSPEAIPREGRIGWPYRLGVSVRNAGSADWPVVEAPRMPLILDLTFAPVTPAPLTVVLSVRWRAVGTDAWLEPQRVPLRRDVPAGEAMRQDLLLLTPPTPGTYEVEVRLEQLDGARFDGPGNVPLRLTVPVVG